MLAVRDRFAAFGALPTADRRAVADDLEHTVARLGFKSAVINAPTHSVFDNQRRFWPIY
jgi:predicted TIM-barrel fold metal-dependent hydrolase